MSALMFVYHAVVPLGFVAPTLITPAQLDGELRRASTYRGIAESESLPAEATTETPALIAAVMAS
jgi:hypothetical protein